MTLVNFAKGKIYGVLRACVIADNGENHSHRTDMSHYNLLSVDNGANGVSEQYQINIDIQSLQSPNVKCVCLDPFNNESISFENIPLGFTPLTSNENDLVALDLIRRPVFDLNLLTQSQALTADEIAAKLDVYLKQGQPNVIVFGTKYDDQPDLPAEHYGKQRALKEHKPSRGVDDIHMNQVVGKDGHAYQDGALFIEKPSADKTYVAFFFCFDSQCKK